MSYSSLPIVGVFYGPERGYASPAIVRCMAIGTPLELRAEPDNPADPNAVAVWLKTPDFPEANQDALRIEIAGYGHTIEQFLAMEGHHLGYIPKQIAAKLRAGGIVNDDPVPVTFTCAADGRPRVQFDTPVL
jgi:hypothetical protein